MAAPTSTGYALVPQCHSTGRPSEIYRKIRARAEMRRDIFADRARAPLYPPLPICKAGLVLAPILRNVIRKVDGPGRRTGLARHFHSQTTSVSLLLSIFLSLPISESYSLGCGGLAIIYS